MYIIEKLQGYFDAAGIESKKNLKLSRCSSFKIGGECGLAVYPHNADEVMTAVASLKNAGVRFGVIGNASNILFSDKGYDGVLIFTGAMRSVRVLGDSIIAQSGVSLCSLARLAAKHFLSGFEFAYGIPGTLGGAVYMNAGAYGGDMAQVVDYSLCLDTNSGKLLTLNRKEHVYSYRSSVFSNIGGLIILETGLKLRRAEGDAQIMALMSEYMRLRREKQPLEYPSAGSVFKRPEGAFAGKLIEDCGLKGFSIGGAAISVKHAGFIVNTGGATAHDVMSLIEYTKKTVYEKFGIMLECEIKYFC